MPMRVEIRPHPTDSEMWQEVEITYDAPGERSLRGTQEVIMKNLRAVSFVDAYKLIGEGKYVVQAQANPDIWVTEV